ncbi:Na(+)/H(+) antiporter NhaA 2 [Halomicronema hongdechloris C2206]|uniref:Na(+)/H(+) antiporter NhaA 2 n=1 Tax=Halomicronema hongdechloris C2206 TaxID=1641165 RepID=A0A1Z3HKV2_9CYAN|nr:thioredoxin domain-containing protein [Halomicronema hongdechloris]ASC70941.1 Na(+)/H(+) antiporter NhaA 2 [Halomicronema hongdechloris C2206]
MDQSPGSGNDVSRWKWIGMGFFGAAGIALIAALVMLLTNGLPEPTVSREEDVAADPAAETDRQADLQARQQVVREVVSTLDRETLIGNSPTRGAADAEVVLFEFSDFQCPYCARGTEEVDRFLAEHEEDVLFVYKHLPLIRIHPEAVPAAKAAWAAGQQGQFWPYHDALFSNQERLGDTLYVELAETLGLDQEQFERDRNSPEAEAAIARDLALADELQINSTPTFIMGDILIPGAVPAEFFAEALERIQTYNEAQSSAQ